MNAPLPLHVTPVVAAPALPVRTPRDIPAAFMAALQARFAANCSTARMVREQHGRDESSFDAPPPAAVVFAQNTQDVADAVALASAFSVPVIPFGVGTSLKAICWRCRAASAWM